MIEDPLAVSDVEGYKKFIAKVKQDHQRIRVVVTQLFESSIEKIKEVTQFIQEESDDEEGQQSDEN